MHLHGQFNWLAILVSVVVSFAIGGLWYGPLFGRAWRTAIGVAPDAKPSGTEMGRAFALNILGILLMAFALDHLVIGARILSVNHGEPYHPTSYALFAAFLAWFGFVVPILLNGVAFEGRSWRFFGINATYQLISLIVMGLILSYWR
jgi:hypothetical protein